MADAYWVYRLFGEGDGLLYVGYTRNPEKRLAQHRVQKPWWPSVTRQTLTEYATRSEARSAEKVAIAVEGPKHNIQLRPRTIAPQREHATWTPVKTYRVEDSLYQAVKAKADANGQTVTQIIKQAFHAYVEAGE